MPAPLETYRKKRSLDRTHEPRGKVTPEPKPPEQSRKSPAEGLVAGARRAKFPRSAMEPQLATLTDEVPKGDEWFHEIKLDGYRFQAHIDGKQVKLYTRRGLDWSRHFPEIARVLGAAELGQCVLDGEMVMLDERGVSDFQALQNALDDFRRTRNAVFFAFDLLHWDGWDLSGAALEERKRCLRTLLSGHFTADASIRYCDHVVGHGEDAYREACKLGLEGIVSKQRKATYHAGRNTAWLKSKCSARQELVIGGYSDPAGSRSHFGALLLGVYRDGKLCYAGKTGTGFTEASLAELHARLAPLEQAQPAFADPPRGAEARGVHWLRPELVAEVAFAGFTSEGRVRQAVFQGLRDDKPAREVGREAAVPVAQALASVEVAEANATLRDSRGGPGAGRRGGV
jgi:bifunctional non-homologous end joining protein LigD